MSCTLIADTTHQSIPDVDVLQRAKIACFRKLHHSSDVCIRGFSDILISFKEIVSLKSFISPVLMEFIQDFLDVVPVPRLVSPLERIIRIERVVVDDVQ